MITQLRFRCTRLFLSICCIAGFAAICISCTQGREGKGRMFGNRVSRNSALVVHGDGNTIASRFDPPAGYVRMSTADASFGRYLQTLPLKPQGALVQTFDGRIKDSTGIYCAVVDLPIGNKDLHQCADAVMRLRAEYLWKNKQYDAIHFDLTNGFRMDYTEWMQGKRLVVNGNATQWAQKAAPSNTASDLWAYLEKVFTYAGTLSLSRELQPVEAEHMEIGDVFIRGGSPGHAVIVVDMAKDTLSGEKLFMLAQSYMPAQEIQILLNGEHPEMGPWYALDFGDVLHTPSWRFDRGSLTRFPED